MNKFKIDGVTLLKGSRILFDLRTPKEKKKPALNGIYVVTAIGSLKRTKKIKKRKKK